MTTPIRDPKAFEVFDPEDLLELEPDHIDSERMFSRVSEKIDFSAPATSAGATPLAATPADATPLAATPARGVSGTRGASGTHSASAAHRRPSARRSRTPLGRWKTILIAAAIIMALPLLTGAGVYLATGKNPIDYVFKNPSPEGVQLEEEGGIRIHGIEIPNLELFNAPIGQRIESAGVTVTLDTIAIDDNYVSAFFTYEFDEPVDLDTAVDKGWSSHAINLFIPQPSIWANGEMIGDGQNRESKESTCYFADDARTVVKQTTRYMIPGWLPDNLEIEISLAPFTSNYVYRSALQETIFFAAQVDKSAASAQTRGIAPGQYVFDTADGERILDIEKFALTPFGAVLTIRAHWTDEGTWDGKYLRIQDLQFSAPSDAQIGGFSYRQATPEDDFISVELLASYAYEDSERYEKGVAALRTEVLPFDITALTITPLKKIVVAPDANVDPGGYLYERNLYSLSDIGVNMPTSPTGGLILKNVEVEGSRLVITAETYGDCEGVELSPRDEGIITLTAQSRVGLLTSNYDADTRIFTQVIDYYAATEGEIRNITTILVVYGEFIGFDDAAARTFELTAGHPKS